MASLDPKLVNAALDKTGASEDRGWMYPDGVEPDTFRNHEPEPAPVQQSVSYEPSGTPPVESRPEPIMSEAPPPAETPAPAAPVTITVGGPAAPKPARPKPAPAPAAPGSSADLDPYMKPEFRGEAPPIAPSAGTPVPNATAPDSEPQHPVDGVEDLPFNPGAKTRQLRGEAAAADQRNLDILGEGEDTIVAHGAERDRVEGERAAAAADSIVAKTGREDDAHARAEEMRAKIDTELADLKEKQGHPPFDTVGLVFGLVSALAAAHGKEGAAHAFQSLGQAVNHRMQTWKAQVEAGQDHVEGMGKLVNQDTLAHQNEEQARDAITKNVAAEFDNALDHVDAQAKTEQQRQGVAQTRNMLRKTLATAELKKRADAAAAARKAQAYARIGQAKTQEEREGIANQYGELGQKASRDILKTQKDTSELTGSITKNQLTEAQTEATKADVGLKGAQAVKEQALAAKALGAGGDGGVQVGEYTLPGNLPNQAVAKIVDGGVAMATLQTYYNRLFKIAEDVKSGKISKLDANTIEEVHDIRNGLVGLKTNFHGAGAPTGKEYDQTIDTTADPQAFFKRSDARERLRRSLTNQQSVWDNRMKMVHARKGEAPGSMSGGGLVSVTGPDGNSMTVSPAAAAALAKTAGYSVEGDEE